MSDLTPITREEALLDGQDLEPITRKEQFIKRIYDKTQEVPDPITREEWFLKKAGEGTSPVTIEQLNATENGTYSEPGKAYSPVIVEVPEPTLITKSITANGTYTASADNADGYSSVTVAVEGFKKKSIANTPTDIASFDDGTANPMPSLEISINPVQSGSGDPSPSNVRPISGWSGADVTRCATRNLLDANATTFKKWRLNRNNLQTVADSSTEVTYSISNNGTITVTPTGSFMGIGFKINPSSQKRYLSVNRISGESTYVIFFFADYQNNARVIRQGGDDQPQYINAGESGWIGIAFFTSSATQGFKFQLECGDSATEFVDFQGSTLSIPFHDSSDTITVYGGTLNVTSGELRVDRVKRVLSANDTFTKLGDTTVYLDTWLDIVKPTSPELGLLDCSHYKEVLQSSATDSCIAKPINNRAIIFFDSVHATSVNDFKAYITEQINNNTPIEVVYELATPQTYQLTPTQVATLLNQNNIFADCGQILEGEYFVTL